VPTVSRMRLPIIWIIFKRILTTLRALWVSPMIARVSRVQRTLTHGRTESAPQNPGESP
jgi:hypothetical protein